jgi:hypothetical protein
MNTQQTLEKMKRLRLPGMLQAYSSSIESQGHLQLTADEHNKQSFLFCIHIRIKSVFSNYSVNYRGF